MRPPRLPRPPLAAFGLALVLGLLVHVPTAHGATSSALAGLMPAYEAARTALSSDLLGDLAQPARELRQDVRQLAEGLTAETAGVTPEQLAAVRALLPALRKAADALTAAGSLPAARDAFAELSKALIAWRKLAGAGPDVAFCPMANRKWLQAAGSAIENPYLGRAMAGCGELMPEDPPSAPRPGT